MDSRLAVAASAVLLLGMQTPAFAAIDAVWKKHELNVGYQGFTTSYSCEGLKDKVKALLVFFGAREEGMKVRAYGCAADPYRPAPAVNLQLEFETLAPADGAQSGLVAATWIERDVYPEVKVQQEAPQHITRGDCEMVQRFTDTVLPSFTHETMQDLTTCIPHRLDGTIPNLRVKVLVPEPTKKT